MLLLWPCFLLLITIYLFVVNEVFLRLLKAVDFVVVVVVYVFVVALLTVTGHIILSCGQ